MDSKPSCLLRGTTLAVCSLRPSLRAISIPVPLTGHDGGGDYLVSDPALISIHMPLAGHDSLQGGSQGLRLISIHMPLAGHDCKFASVLFTGLYFNPRAPCGARPAEIFRLIPNSGFQSTCPLRGTTPTLLDDLSPEIFQSTCPLRGTTAI